MVRLVFVVAVELIVVVLLALQLVAAPATAEAPADAPASEAPPPPPPPSATGTGTAAPSAPTANPTPTTTQRDEVVAAFRADDPVGIVMSGTVLWPDGTPVAKPSLHFAQSGKSLGPQTSEDGHYALAGLTPGTWDVAVSADGGVHQTVAVELTDAAFQTRDFTLDRSFPVKVRIVTADGADGTRALRTASRFALDLHVVGRRERFPDRLAPTDYGVVLAGDARWDDAMNPKDGNAGTLHFVSAPPAHAALLLRHIVVDQQVVQPGQQELVFTIDVDAVRALAGSATVRVVDAATGAPIAKAMVSLATSNRMGGGPTTDEDGRATFDNLPPGLLQLTVHAKDRERMSTLVRVEAGQQVDLGEVRLGAEMLLGGRVLGADGAPCAAARIEWTELKWRTAPSEFVHNRMTRSEADGTFKLWGTGQGTIAVTARSDQGEVAVGVFDNPPAQAVELRLGAAAQLTVLRPADVTRAYTVTLLDAQGRPVEARTFEARSTKGQLSLPAGEYAYQVHDERDALVQSGRVTLGGEPATLEIR